MRYVTLASHMVVIALVLFPDLTNSLVSLAGIHDQQQQFHIRPNLQLRTGLTLKGELHRGKENPPPPTPPPCRSCSVWPLLLAVCSHHAIRPNGLWWLNKNAPPPPLSLSTWKANQQCLSVHSLCLIRLHGFNHTPRPSYKKQLQDKILAKNQTVQKIA